MNRDIRVIGLSGKANSGKDFISQHWFRVNGYTQWSLAWHFKVGIVGRNDATHEEVFVTKPPHIRKLLQEEGTERGRYIYGENVWLDTTKEWFNILHDYCGINKFIIPDVRFINEVNYIKNELNGAVIRIHAPNRVNDSTLTAEARNHISETELDNYTDFDFIIHNDYNDNLVKEMQLLFTKLNELGNYIDLNIKE